MVDSEHEVNDVPSYEDAIKNLMNINTFDGKQPDSKSQVRVVIAYPNGDVTVKQAFSETTESLLRNIALKKWATAANIVFNHSEIMDHIPDVLRRKINAEFQVLSSSTILNGTSLDELISFKNNLFLHEV